MNSRGEPLIRLNSVYKIFGPRPRGRAFNLVKAGFGKNEVQRRTGHVVGLDDVTFEIGRGELFVVMGLSGSGKSTAIRTVNKLHDITSGEVWVDGTNVQALSGQELQEFRKRNMGMVFQHFALFPHRNVLDNAAYALKVQKVDKHEREQAAMEALNMVGLGSFALAQVSELSGGMQQRVGLARALASNTDIMLMDEAFSALDPLIRRQMQDEMMAIQAKLHKTILFITHDLNEALRIGDRVCIMRDGRVVQIGTPEEILTQPATGYVAEFVQDVDQGRVIEASEVMKPPDPIKASELSIQRSVAALDGRTGVFVVDQTGKPTGVVTASDVISAIAAGNNEMPAVRSEFYRAHPNTTLNEVYAAAGQGVPIAIVDESGNLVGNLDPKDIMEEMGRVEQLADGFEREVYL